MDHFDTGRRDDFFSLWEYVPSRVRRLDAVAHKLEFYANIHFAVFPYRPAARRQQESSWVSPEKAMQMFKRYIESQGQGLAQTPEFLAYYAVRTAIGERRGMRDRGRQQRDRQLRKREGERRRQRNRLKDRKIDGGLGVIRSFTTSADSEK